MKKIYPIIGFLLILSSVLHAQLRITCDSSLNFYINSVLLGGHVETSGYKFHGSHNSIAYFESDDFLIQKGLLLTTGDVHLIGSQNTLPNTSSALMVSGSYDLYKITNKDNFDASALEFDFKPEFDSFYFNFIFASEEYEEFVGSKYNDVFAFFLRAHGSGNAVNLAKIPGTNTIVSVNTINNKRNKELYVSNLGKTDIGYAIEYDGFTRVMSAGAQVEPGRWYHIKIVVADVMDQKYDSGVFLEQGSFTSLPREYPQEGKIKKGNFYENINYASDSFEVPFSALDFLNKLSDYLKSHPDLSIIITGHTDNVGSLTYNKILSTKRAQKIAEYLTKQGIETTRISYEGMGSSQAVATNETAGGRAKNRRIEFHIQ